MTDKKILVIGVYDLTLIPNTVWDCILELKSSRNYDVKQAWVKIGMGHENFYTRLVANGNLKPWFFHINDLLDKEGLDPFFYDYLVTCQDDADLPKTFLDRFIPIMEEFGFDAAQGARPEDSYIAHRHSALNPGCRARLVNFIEAGPCNIFNRKAVKILLEENRRFQTRWPFGIDCQFAYKAKQANLRLGYIDEIPVGHIRPYRNDETKTFWKTQFWRSIKYGQGPDILSTEERNAVLEVYM